jgi:hypothetical protein
MWPDRNRAIEHPLDEFDHAGVAGGESDFNSRNFVEVDRNVRFELPEVLISCQDRQR